MARIPDGLFGQLIGMSKAFAEFCHLHATVFSRFPQPKKLTAKPSRISPLFRRDDWGSWFWRGLPDHEPHTICLGPAYARVWPEVLKTGHKIGEHHNMLSSDRFGNKPPRPPRNLVAPDQKDKNPGGKTEYASVFPFDYEFDYDRYIW